MKIAVAQLNYHIGNFESNFKKIKDSIQRARSVSRGRKPVAPRGSEPSYEDALPPSQSRPTIRNTPKRWSYTRAFGSASGFRSVARLSSRCHARSDRRRSDRAWYGLLLDRARRSLSRCAPGVARYARVSSFTALVLG